MVGVIGAGGLGTYAVQYAKLLSSGATVVAFARTDEKLAIAKEHGADHVINTRGKSIADIRTELQKATGNPEIEPGLCGRGRFHSRGIQLARDIRCFCFCRPHRHSDQHSTLPICRSGVHLPRLLLGQLQRSGGSWL